MPTSPPLHAVIGVDVGTESVRAGVVAVNDGRILATHVRGVRVWNARVDHYEQSSEEIWAAVCECVKTALAASKSSGDDVRVQAIGFDATCSMVVLDEHDAPVSVTAVDDNDASNNSKNIKDTALSDASPHTVDTSNTHTRNIIMWLDHRAAHEADDINASSHEVLRYVGGRVSVEMQTPKLLWLKRHHPQTWARARHFFDLPDFLTYRATGNQQRSLCSSACKWTFSKDGGWSRSYMELAGLGELAEEGFARLGGGGDEFTEPGSAVGMLTPRAAADLGLSMDVCVASGLIDAYAGALGILAVPSQVASKESTVTSNGSAAVALTSTLAIIAGTSSCHIAVSKDAHFAPGIWGPYDSVLLPGHHAVEGGQSAAGKLLDFIIETHPAYDDAKRAAEVEGAASIYAYLNKHLERMRDLRKLSCIDLLIKDVHVVPDFHGNRSPLADGTRRGMITGLTLSHDIDALATLYLATIAAIAYGTRHIIDTLRESSGCDSNGGFTQLQRIAMTGGLALNPVFVQAHADATGMPVIVPTTSMAVILGAAMAAAAAVGRRPLQEVMRQMAGDGVCSVPSKLVVDFHERKYRVFRAMLEAQGAWRDLMNDGVSEPY